MSPYNERSSKQKARNLLLAFTTGVSVPHSHPHFHPHPSSPPVCSQLAEKWATYGCQHEHVSSLNKRRRLLAFLADCHGQFSCPARHSCQDTRQRARLTPRALMVTADAAVCSSAQATVQLAMMVPALKCVFNIYLYVKSVQK